MKNILKIALLVSSLYMGTAMAAGQFGQFGSGPQLLTASSPSQGGFNQDDQDDSDQGLSMDQDNAPSASGQFGQQPQQFNQGQFNQPQQSQFAPSASGQFGQQQPQQSNQGQFNQPQQSQFAPSASGQFNQPQQSQFAPSASGQFGQQQPQQSQQQSTGAGSTGNSGSGIQIPVAISNMMTPSQVYLQGYSDALNFVSQSMDSTAPAGDTEGGVNGGFSSQQQPQQQFAPSASQGQFAQQQQQPQQQAPVNPYSYAVPGEPGGIDPTPTIGVPVNQNSGQGGFSQNQDDQNYQDQDNEDTAGSFNNNQQQLNF